MNQLGRNYPKNSRKKEMELKVLVCAVRQPAGYANALVLWCTLRKMGEEKNAMVCFSEKNLHFLE